MNMRLILIGVGVCITLAAAALLPRIGGGGDRFSVAQALLAEGRGDQAALLFDDPIWRGAAEYQAGDIGAPPRPSVRPKMPWRSTIWVMHRRNWAHGLRPVSPIWRFCDLSRNTMTPLHNLDLVTAAQKLADELAEAARKVRQAGASDDATDAINKKGETATEDPDGGSRRSIGDVQAADDASQTSGEASRPGRAAERDAAESATGATATLFGGENRTETTADGTGAAMILRDSMQAAEILLRRIKDDPARVLRARLRAAHEARKEGATQ